MSSSIVYIDMDAFFASVEIHDNPYLRGKPLIIGSLPGEKRGVVSTASYEARKYGVHSAMPTAKAYRLCPNGLFMKPRMKRYQEVSAAIMRIFYDYSPTVIQKSIDEAMIDLTGTERLFGMPRDTVMQIKKRVMDECALTLSAGLASNGYIAKMASEVNKPDGFYEVKEGDEEAFMLHLPLEKVYGVGSATLSRLKSAGLRTTRSIHKLSLATLEYLVGTSCAQFLYDAVRGKEAKSFTQPPSSHSISCERTFPVDITNVYAAESAIMEMCYTVYFRMRGEGVTSRTIVLKIRYGSFDTVTCRESCAVITSLDDLFNRCRALFEKKYDRTQGLRLIGVAVDNTSDGKYECRQRDLFTSEMDDRRRAVEEAVAAITAKDSTVKITRGRMIKTNSPRTMST